MAVAFDALGLAEDWEKAGIAPEQARKMAAALRDRLHDTLATKADLEQAVGQLRTAIGDLRTEVRTEIADLRTELRTEIAGLRGELRSEVATLRGELRSEVAALRGELHREIMGLRGEMQGMRAGLVQWFAGMLILQAGVITVLVKLL